MQKIRLSIIILSTTLVFLFVENTLLQIFNEQKKILAIGNLDYPLRQKDAISLVLEQGYSRAEASRNLEVNPNLLGCWVKEHQQDEGQKTMVILWC